MTAEEEKTPEKIPLRKTRTNNVTKVTPTEREHISFAGEIRDFILGRLSETPDTRT